MDWLNSFNAVFDHLENNLDNEIDCSYVAKNACCSEFHFSRMFSSLANVPLSEYVRRSRLTKAVFEIQVLYRKQFDI